MTTYADRATAEADPEAGAGDYFTENSILRLVVGRNDDNTLAIRYDDRADALASATVAKNDQFFENSYLLVITGIVASTGNLATRRKTTAQTGTVVDEDILFRISTAEESISDNAADVLELQSDHIVVEQSVIDAIDRTKNKRWIAGTNKRYFHEVVSGHHFDIEAISESSDMSISPYSTYEARSHYLLLTLGIEIEYLMEHSHLYRPGQIVVVRTDGDPIPKRKRYEVRGDLAINFAFIDQLRINPTTVPLPYSYKYLGTEG